MTALAAGGIMVSAATAPVQLVGVSSQDNAVLIESTEPVAYSVSRPDPLTLLVDLRNVSVSDARADVVRSGPLAGVKLEQAAAVDGASLARVRVSLTRPSEYRVRSARNTIRVELTAPAAAGQADAAAAAPAPEPARQPARSPGPATLLERVRSRRTPSSTTVTMSGNGQLVPVQRRGVRGRSAPPPARLPGRHLQGRQPGQRRQRAGQEGQASSSTAANRSSPAW